MKKIVPVIVLALLFAIALFNDSALELSPTWSWVVTILLGLAMVVVLILSMTGKMIERRIVFLFVGISLVLPFFMNFTMPLNVSPVVQTLYDALNKLPKGSKVLASFDYDPPSAPELQPMADAFVKWAFRNDIKVIIVGLWPQGPLQANLSVEAAMADPEIAAKNPKYGVDYVNLGFQTGNEFVIQGMGTSFRAKFPTDLYNTPYDSIPLMRGVENFSNIDFVMNLSSGYPGTVEWVQIAVDRFGVPVGAGNTAVQAPQVYPYVESGQLTGLLGGMSGAAEFEKATGEAGQANTFLLSQSFAHLVVVGFILIGNVALFIGQNRRRAPLV